MDKIELEENITADNFTEKPGDFEYAQTNKSIHDTKFQTKPTTFMKDAMKRFAKNKSSVTAAGILAVIILMAIIVPVADRNNIEVAQPDLSYLPPKWFDNANGFMDGTGYVSDCIIDPDTGKIAQKLDKDLKKTDTYYYMEDAIISDKTITERTTDILTDEVKVYGRGGYFNFAAGRYLDKDGNLSRRIVASPEFTYDVSDDLSFDADYGIEEMKGLSGVPSLRPVVIAYFTSNAEIIPLDDFAVPEAGIVLENTITDKIISTPRYVSEGAPATFKARIGFEINNDDTKNLDPNGDVQRFPQLLIEKITANSITGAMDVSKIGFNDATTMLAASDGSTWKVYSNGSTEVYKSKMTYASFRYDYYGAAFGEHIRAVAESDFRAWVEGKGWGTYEFKSHPESGEYYGDDIGVLVLNEAGKEYCPIRSVISEKYVYSKLLKTEIRTLNCVVSSYRQLYQEGIIATNAPQKYIFGTNNNGWDFFKIVFSGLLVSLGLGVLSMIINLTIGLIYGSLAGYFGGWVDIILERFTEILGGMPWIVMMTLIIILIGKSNFWVFLLALCITGWMGVAGLTRSQFYRFKGREYVLASRTLGASDARLIFRHILPNGIGTIVTSCAFMIPSVIFSEATISYLLPGAISMEVTTFGVTLSTAQASISSHPYMIISASIVMMLIMISFNLFGNGLRDAFNPSLKGADE